MISRRNLMIGAGTAVIASPAIAEVACTMDGGIRIVQPPTTLFDAEHQRSLRSAWECFCWNADQITNGAHGWKILGAGRLEEGPFIQLVRVEIDRERSSPGFLVEQHVRIVV